MGLNEITLLVLSVISPIIVSYLTKSTMGYQAKQTVSIIISVVIAIIVAFLTGGASLVFTDVNGFFESLAIAAPIVYGIQQLVYTYIFKGTTLEKKVLADKGVTPSDEELLGH